MVSDGLRKGSSPCGKAMNNLKSKDNKNETIEDITVAYLNRF